MSVRWEIYVRKKLSENVAVRMLACHVASRCRRRGFQMVSALDCGLSGLGSSFGRELLRSWVRQFALKVPLSAQTYKWVPAIYTEGYLCDRLVQYF